MLYIYIYIIAFFGDIMGFHHDLSKTLQVTTRIKPTTFWISKFQLYPFVLGSKHGIWVIAIHLIFEILIMGVKKHLLPSGYD